VDGDPPPSAFGNVWPIKDQLIYIVSVATQETQVIDQFRNFNLKDKDCEAAHNLIFESSIDYYAYESANKVSKIEMSLTATVLDYIVQLADCLRSDFEFTMEEVNKSMSLNLVYNCGIMVSAVNDALSLITKFVSTLAKQAKHIQNYCLVGILIFALGIFPSTLIFQVNEIRNAKEVIYRCLISLPKNAVDQILDRLQTDKTYGGETGSDIREGSKSTRQERNAMKIFHLFNGKGTRVNDMFRIILFSIMSMFFAIFVIIFFYQMTIEQLNFVIQSAPHLDSIQGSYAMFLGSLLSLSILSVMNTVISIAIFNCSTLLERYIERSQLSRDFYNRARYGRKEEESPPFSGFASSLASANAMLVCLDEEFQTDSIYEIAVCISIDEIFTVLAALLEEEAAPFFDFQEEHNSDGQRLAEIFDLLSYPIYDVLINPMHQNIVRTIRSDLLRLRNMYYYYLFVFMLGIIVLQIFSIEDVVKINTHMHQVMLLLLQAPPSIVLKTPKIVSVLAGDFSGGLRERMRAQVHFAGKILKGLPDAVIIFSPEGKIVDANEAFFKLTNLQLECVIGSSINNIICVPRFSGDFTQLFSGITKTEIRYNNENGSMIYFNAIMTSFSSISFITMYNITAKASLEEEIKAEHKKVESLLRSMLPSQLVSRVEGGDSKIAFSIRSASIIFIDIVDFSSFYRSRKPQDIIAAINTIFTTIDDIAANFRIITKLKCIGDTYMAAGGLFEEANLPIMHAKDTVDLGLKVIEAVESIRPKIQVRVGVNTAGPVVAGIIGTGRPTFEVIGGAINLAQQMQQVGIPMNVQITRAVYELIYGTNFIFKERGAVEVKGGSIITYLVTKKK
jgi:class 3 adenylate cyclase/PAS domain-containing protein